MGAGSSCPIGDPDAPPPPCDPPSNNAPPPIITPKVANVGQSSGGVWDTSLNQRDIQPLHY